MRRCIRKIEIEAVIKKACQAKRNLINMTWRLDQYDDALLPFSLVTCGTPATAVRNVSVRKTTAWGRLSVAMKMSVMVTPSAFKMKQDSITASPQVTVHSS